MRVSAAENPVPIWERTTLTMAEAVNYTGMHFLFHSFESNEQFNRGEGEQ